MSLADIETPGPAAALDLTTNDTAALRRGRHATRALFATLGMLAGVWGAHIPSLKAEYALNEGQLAMALFAAAVGSVTSLFFAGRLIGRLGTRRAALLTGLVLTCALAAVLNWPSFVWMLLANFIFGLSMSVYDVTINAEGTALEARSGKAIMGSLHGMFSLGAMVGALLAAAMLNRSWDPKLQLLGVGVAMALALVIAQRGMLDAHPASEQKEGHAHFVWPRGLLLLIGLLIFAGMTAEGVMYDWCVLYLKQEVGMTQDVAALGYAAFAGAMAVARFAGDGMRARFADAVLLRYSASLAAVSMAVVLLSGHPVVSLVGYALIGAGLAPIVPLLFTAASRVPGSSSAAAIAAVSSIGYSGFLIGPPLIGAIAHNSSLTAALGVVVVASAALAWGARRVA
ncbi:MAG: hypothetical protein RJA34_1901 [Pseudomonadota bacterium]|jgi:fucose permease